MPQKKPTTVALCKLKLLSANPAPLRDPFQWKLILEVDGERPPAKAIDVAFLLIVDPAKAGSDVVLDEMEIGPLSLGLNEMTMDCDGPSWKKVQPYVLDGTMGLMVAFSYSGTEFLTAGCPVRIYHRLEEGPNAATELPEEFLPQDMRRSLQAHQMHVNRKAINFDDSTAHETLTDEEEEEEEEEEKEANESTCLLAGQATETSGSSSGESDDSSSCGTASSSNGAPDRKRRRHETAAS